MVLLQVVLFSPGFLSCQLLQWSNPDLNQCVSSTRLALSEREICGPFLVTWRIRSVPGNSTLPLITSPKMQPTDHMSTRATHKHMHPHTQTNIKVDIVCVNGIIPTTDLKKKKICSKKLQYTTKSTSCWLYCSWESQKNLNRKLL